MISRLVDTYRRTAKPRDIPWNKYVARPLASVVLVALGGARVTPNQITLASLVVFAVAAALLVLMPGQRGLLIAVAVLELSYVLDCVDGQLARLRGTSSPVGAHLDFLMDELKAFLLVAASAARLWGEHDDERWLAEGLGGLVVVATAISLTTFVRRPEYAAATGARAASGAGDYGSGFAPMPVTAAARSPLGHLVGAVESLGKFLMHYPSYMVIVAAFDRLDIFLHAYLAINAAHAARSLLGIALKLGRFSR